MKQKIVQEENQIDDLMKKLCTPLCAHGNIDMAKRFLKGGYKQDGYGVPEGSAINGSFSFEGEQGYYVEDSCGKQAGRQVFLETVDKMRMFFKKRARRIGKPIRFIIKPGIGGQHTPFQGIADIFDTIEAGKKKSIKICGEYELGKDFELFMIDTLKELKAEWDEVCVIPSSKSGSTDETMMVFVDIFYAMLKHQAVKKGIDGEKFADIVLNTLNEVNFLISGGERPAKDLFKVDKERFGTDSLIVLIFERAKTLNISFQDIKDIFGKVLGNMFFETTDRVEQSRLSAFIRNSGLDEELGEDAPGFGAMFDNVGGRWTADLHMMTYLAYYGLDAEAYWKSRRDGICKVRQGKHIANAIAKKIVDSGITDIGLLVPEEFFWFGKSIEQNFNESIWQNGFSNLIAIRDSQWDAQKQHYANNPKRLVINMSNMAISKDSFNIVTIDIPVFKPVQLRKLPGRRATCEVGQQQLVNAFAELFTLFYGITSCVGNALIVKALYKAGYSVSDVDLNNLDNPATRIVQENLYLRQPYVELGKGLLENKLKELQEKEYKSPGAISREYEKIKETAKAKNEFKGLPGEKGRKLVPFIYLEGDRFYDLRDYLISKGVEWVMQGTGDQHISYQQVLAQPGKYLPFIISIIPEKPVSGRPAVGFAKPYLHNISPNMVRDFFAEASYKALVSQGGLGFFIRVIDNKENINIIKKEILNFIKTI